MLTLPDEYNTLFAQIRLIFSKRVLEVSRGSADWSHSDPRQTHRNCRTSHYGLEPRAALSELPPCAEPGSLVQPGT